ncbi:MAG: NAD-dependent epimerase/dehydratase family protein [Chthoniobacterales bacterium]
MKILVTGGSGFIGSHVVEHYQEQAEVIILDNLRTGHRSNLEGLKCTFIEGSILDRKLLDSIIENVDVVFHLAALVSVPESVEQPMETVNINISGLLNVLESARHANVRKLCFASSAAVYGENKESPKKESMTPDPRSPYAITKLDGEYYCDFYTRQSWLDTACLRFFNVFGPRQDPGSAYAAAIPIFIQRALENKLLNIYGDGEQTRDFIYVKDIVGALAFLAENTSLHGVFNAGYGGSQTINTLAKSIIKQIDTKSEIVYADPRPGDIRHSLASAEKLESAGWQARFELDEAIAETIRFMSNAQ